MEKKFDIKLEVIHFNTEDVIVTSGFGLYGNLVNNTPYWTKSSELNESSINYSYNETSYCTFFFNGESFSEINESRYNKIDDDSGFYAYFKEGAKIWWTENQKKSSYGSSADLPWTDLTSSQ